MSRNSKTKKVIAVTVTIQECDKNGDLKVGGKTEAIFYDAVNTANPDHKITALFFGDNSVNNILAKYYDDNIYKNKPITVEEGSPLSGLTIADKTVAVGNVITPIMMKKHWERSDICIMAKCANSQICP